MILTREEYEQIVRQKAKAESEAAVAKSNAAAAIEQADRDAQRKIREAAEETQEEINKIHQDCLKILSGTIRSRRNTILCSKGGFGQIIVLDTGRLSFPIPSRLGLFRQICGHIDSWNAAVV